jgi:SAM-dependent methyltransferase
MLAAASGVAQERGLSNITFEPADAESLPYPDAQFDLVTCRIAAHHFSDPGQAMREMARACKPGGVVGLIDPIVPSDRKLADEINAWELLRDPSTASVLTVNAWSSLFCAAGLDAVHINTFQIPLDFDDLLARSSRDAATTAELRAGLLGGSDGLRAWLKPEVKEGRLAFVWPQVLVVGRKH